MYSNTTGNYNAAMGKFALKANTTGNYNAAFGANALTFNTASNNTALGFNTLVTNTTGSYNTATGRGALYYNTTGTYNSASGYAALRLNTTGSYNTGIGARALDANTEGEKNTVVGHYAGGLNTTGDGNVFIGYKSGYNSSYATADNKLVIANDTTNTPLIEGDFSAAMLKVNGVFTADTLKGDGSQLTGLSTGGSPNTEVFNGSIPSTWTDLDLSSVVGQNKAMVLLRVDLTNWSSGEENRLLIRPNGDTNEYFFTYSGGSSSAQLSSLNVLGMTAQSGTTLVTTDDSGVVEIKTPNSNYNGTISINVIFFIHS